jgi:PPM family protein phosphatase
MKRFDAYGETDIGRVKRNNEDALDYLISREGTFALAVVADGVGGNPGGEVASQVAVAALLAEVRGQAARVGQARAPEALRRVVMQATEAANAAVRRCQLKGPELAHMATTVVAALVTADLLALAHAGDSRCYRLRRGTLESLTEDHTVAQQMLRTGELEPDALAHSPYHQVLTRALGLADSVEITTGCFDLIGGDTLLLCSDGLTAVLSDADIEQVLMAGGSLAATTREMIDRANAAGGPDNVSVLLLRVL